MARSTKKAAKKAKESVKSPRKNRVSAKSVKEPVMEPPKRYLALIGTSHVSPESVREIKQKIKRLKPQCVAVELDPGRYVALKQGNHVSPKAIKQIGFRMFIMAFFLSAVQRYLGRKTGVMPGEEMLTAIEAARAQKADVALIDRDISITFARLKARLTFTEKMRLFFSLFKRVNMEEKFDIHTVPSDSLVSSLLIQMQNTAPTLYDVLVAERDAHMALVLKNLMQKYDRVIAVVGAAHKQGIEKQLSSEKNLN